MTSSIYNPAPFRLDDPVALGRLIDSIVFGTLLCNGPEGPLASHVPLLLERQAGAPGVLRAHLALVNEHWRALDGAAALVIFHGPEHYVTPSWYASKYATGKVVPTWNYVVVHARGRAAVHRDPVRLRSLVEALTDRMEAPREAPWRVNDAPAPYVDRMIEQIVGIDIVVERLEGKFKLGQNRSAADRASLEQGLARERPETFAALRRLPVGD